MFLSTSIGVFVALAFQLMAKGIHDEMFVGVEEEYAETHAAVSIDSAPTQMPLWCCCHHEGNDDKKLPQHKVVNMPDQGHKDFSPPANGICVDKTSNKVFSPLVYGTDLHFPSTLAVHHQGRKCRVVRGGNGFKEDIVHKDINETVGLAELGSGEFVSRDPGGQLFHFKDGLYKLAAKEDFESCMSVAFDEYGRDPGGGRDCGCVITTGFPKCLQKAMLKKCDGLTQTTGMTYYVFEQAVGQCLEPILVPKAYFNVLGFLGYNSVCPSNMWRKGSKETLCDCEGKCE